MKTKVYVASDFTGGVNTKRPEYLLGDNELVQMTNMNFVQPGLITSRLGYERYNDIEIPGATKIPWMHRFYDKDGTTKTLVVAANKPGADALYYGDDDTGVMTEITGGSTLTANQGFTSTVFKDILFVTNGVEEVQYYSTGSTKSTLSAPIGKYIETHQERLWLAGDSSNPSRVYFCDIGDETTWGANSYIDVEQNDGGIITGLVSMGQALVVFKSNGVHKIYGTGTSTFERYRVPLFGCAAPYTITKIQGGVIWLSPMGVYYYDGENVQNLSSDKIDSVLKDITGANLSKAVGCYYDSQYWLSFPNTNTYNDTTWVCDLTTKDTQQQGIKPWYKYTHQLSSMVWCVGQDDGGVFYGGDSNGGYIKILETGYNDAGDEITYTLETKHIDGGSPDVKLWKDIILHSRNNDGNVTVTMTPYLDLNEQTDTSTVTSNTAGMWDDSTWGDFYWDGGGTSRSRHRLTQPAKSVYLGLKISGSSAIGQFAFQRYEVIYDILASRR